MLLCWMFSLQFCKLHFQYFLKQKLNIFTTTVWGRRFEEKERIQDPPKNEEVLPPKIHGSLALYTPNRDFIDAKNLTQFPKRMRRGCKCYLETYVGKRQSDCKDLHERAKVLMQASLFGIKDVVIWLELSMRKWGFEYGLL